MSENNSIAQKQRWANFSEEERKEMADKMRAGKKKRSKKNKMSSKSAIAQLNNTFEVAKKLAVVMALAGGREQVIRLLDIVELVTEEEIK